MTEKFDLNEEMEKAGKEGNLPQGGNETEWFKIKEGDNKVRIMSAFIVFPQHYSPNKTSYSGICLGKDLKCPGCIEDDKRAEQKKADPEGTKNLGFTRNIRWFGWLWDYSDSQFKLAKLPHKVMKQIQAYQNNPEYAFSEAPMPYDITISAKGAGTKEVDYNVTAARQNTPVPEDAQKAYEKSTSPTYIKDKMKVKKAHELGIKLPDEAEADKQLDEMAGNKGIEYPDEDINPDDIPF